MTKFVVRFKSKDEKDGIFAGQITVEIKIPQIKDSDKPHRQALADFTDERFKRLGEAVKAKLPPGRSLFSIEHFFEASN